MSKPPLDILLVEDNPADVRMTQEALKETGVAHRLHVARDGMEAIRFLRREAPHAKAARPDLVLLDLNMPRMGGQEFLQIVKEDAHLRSVPVVVLTSSPAETDVEMAYDRHANGYVVKPVGLDALAEVLGATLRFWGEACVLPAKTA